MSEEKTLVFKDDNSTANMLSILAPLLQQKGVDPSVLALMKDKSCCGGDFVWVLFLILLLGGGNWGGYGGNAGGNLANQLNNDHGRELLMQAINGNRSALSELASTLNCDLNAVQSAVNSIGSQIQSVGAQVGMSTQQVINSIQSGDCNIMNSVSAGFCNLNHNITSQAYEGRIATLEQTSHLASKMDANTALIGSKIDNQTNIINEKFCALEMRELQNKLDQQREENSTLKAQMSNMQQTGMFSQMIANAVNPISTAVNNIQSKLPQTITVPANNGVFVPSNVAYGLGLLPYGGNYANGSFWG